ncbi:MAG: hypothetical protein P8172_02170 [Gammaproteobacteria bacterium]|jgi:hypothetical protein
MWKNRHVVVAMLVAPVLAILAWFAVDWFVAERPHAAKPGQDYPLVARSNCRYESGRCDLANEDFRLSILPDTSAGTGGTSLVITSRFPLTAAAIGLAAQAGGPSEPVAFEPAGDDRMRWTGRLPPLPPGAAATLQIVVSAAGSHYFAEVPTIFLQPE